jgi:hypothetical protein
MAAVVKNGNPHSPDSFLHVDKNECTSKLHLSWHLHFEAHTEQHLQAEHGQICRSYPSQGLPRSPTVNVYLGKKMLLLALLLKILILLFSTFKFLL